MHKKHVHMNKTRKRMIENLDGLNEYTTEMNGQIYDQNESFFSPQFAIFTWNFHDTHLIIASNKQAQYDTHFQI